MVKTTARIKRFYKRTLKGLERFFNRSRAALVTAVAAAGAFMAVDGILGILPETFSNIAKIFIGVSIVVAVGWLFPKRK